MPKQQVIPMSHEGALNEYFGGIKGLAKKPLPFKCKCGETIFSIQAGIDVLIRPIMTLADCYTHIKTDHHESIRNLKKLKKIKT